MKDITFKEKVKQGINDLFYIWLREFRTTFRDQGYLSSLYSYHWYTRSSTDSFIRTKWYAKFPPLSWMLREAH